MSTVLSGMLAGAVIGLSIEVIGHYTSQRVRRWLYWIFVDFALFMACLMWIAGALA